MERLFYVVLVILGSEAWGQATVPKTVKQGKDVELMCVNKTWTNDVLYVIWTLKLKDKTCIIRSSQDNAVNTCADDKSLRNSTEGKPVLQIPHFSISDVGIYTCDSAFTGGAGNYTYYINIEAPPDTVSAQIERRGDRTFVTCRADRAKPEASISWAFTTNATVHTVREPDGLISVNSLVEVSAHEDPQNLTCIVTHPFWDEPKVIVPSVLMPQEASKEHVAVYVTVVVSVVFCLALLLWGIIKLHHLRRRQISSAKFSADEYVEEVEPYESYVQRVNSIYNSSRDLFP